MRENLKQTLNFYCDSELKSFNNSPYFSDMKRFTNKLGFEVNSYYKYSESDKNCVYLGFSVVDKSGRTVWIDGKYEGYLSYASSIVLIDKNDRIKFFSWEEDEDFIDSVVCVIKELEKM